MIPTHWKYNIKRYTVRWVWQKIKKMARWIRLDHLDRCGGAISARHKMKYLCREDLEDIIISYIMNREKKDWFTNYLLEEKECRRLEQILRSDYHTDKELNRAKHMADLEVKLKRQKREITMMREKAEVFNNQLYATGLIVNCTGCEAGKPFDGENLTEEKVQEVERIARRLRTWFNNYQYRLNRDKNNGN